MESTGVIKVLMIEDDEDDFIIVRDLLSDLRQDRFTLDWAKSYESGLEQLRRCQHDVALVDYRLGARNGVELVRAAVEEGNPAPLILLTGSRDQELDKAAMKAGASDYLVKGQIRSDALGRSIRYAVQRQRAAALAAFEQARLAAFGAEIGLTLTRRDSLDAILERCAEAMVRYLNAGLAQISVLPPGQQLFEPRAMAGPFAERILSLDNLPRVELELGRLHEGKPIWIKQVLKDPRIADQAWIQNEGVVSYAAFPLALEDQLVGLMSLFTPQPVGEQITQEMGSVAHGIALCIERKRAEIQVQKLAAFPQVNPNPVLEFDAAGKLSYANQAAHDMMNALGQKELLAILPQGADVAVRECLATGQKILRREVTINGRVLTWSYYPVTANRVVHCYGTDITDVQQLESQFRHAQKLESVGQLAAGVAHDFNNILTVIQGHAQLLLARPRADKELNAPLKQISLAAERAAGLTRQLLLFSRKQVTQPKSLDLNATLENLVSMLVRLLGEDIALQKAYAPALPQIEADLGMIEQVVMNLVVNARDAMPNGGRLAIGTALVDIGLEYVSKRPDAHVGSFVCLSVGDTGTGMDAQTLNRIFEPFFTTKAIGKGTGLGLATVYGIVQQHHGWIDVSSEPGRGTTFKIFFPAGNLAAPAAADATKAPVATRGGNETVLIVEDEVMLRQMVNEVLTERGYRVIEAGSGRAAIKSWDQHEGKVDLLFTDMVMPEGMDGLELALKLRQRKPGLKLIFSSGYSGDGVRTALDQNGALFLPKPYSPQTLVQTVRQVLDASDQKPSVGSGKAEAGN